VDCLIFVADHVRRILKEKIPSLEENVRTYVIQNGVDLKRFPYKERKPGYNLAYVGYINHKKNSSLLLQCIKSLVDLDTRYKLHIAGFHEQLRYKLYFENLVRDMGIEDNIKIYGWVDDVASWLEDKNYIISTSIGEGCPVSIMEAMASGIKPLIHNWPGAKELFQKTYIFNTIDEFKNMVLNENYNSSEYREWIETHYSLEEQLKNIEQLL
jgi:glycosyltransferase involved in cell wall biosynthesis